ncbi:hypothetical protein BB560_001154 [Smittium megazygosporum]|uniref:RING-type domain-containing protein n=1 Tax=Smittium megazygosporum TaxID=133381 RepID=A0A2T9ZIB3_9FUNG|nr:hypothetical protein BB560_001154 [Smittium megazygosporum]
MPNYQLKKFNFFKKINIPNFPSPLKAKDAIFFSNNESEFLFVCTPDGIISVFNSKLKEYSFSAIDKDDPPNTVISQLWYSNSKKLLLVVKERESNEAPLLEVWKVVEFKDALLLKGDEFANLKVARIPIMRSSATPFPISAFAVSHDLSLVAVGFGDGLLVILKGNLPSTKNIKQSVITQIEEPITNLHFSKSKEQNGKNSILYATTTSQILVFLVSQKAEKKSRGCKIGCADMSPNDELIVAQDEAIYFYNADGRGPCLAFEGPKNSINVLENHIFISAQNEINGDLEANQNSLYQTSLSELASQANVFYIFDYKNKLISFQSLVPGGIKNVLVAWGSVFVFQNLGSIDYFEEISFSSKIAQAIKQSMFSVAINLSQQSDEDEKDKITAQIHLQYGHYLLEKNEPDLAVNEYISTIGLVDPSFVVVKLLDTQYLTNLVNYLENLDSAGVSNGEHTLLLLTCYSKLGDDSKLIEFVENKLSDSSETTDIPSELNFEKAIQTCLNEGHYKTALIIARRCDDIRSIFDILVYKLFDFNGAISFLKTQVESLDSSKDKLVLVINYVFECGRTIISNLPMEFTAFLADFCHQQQLLPSGFKKLFLGLPEFQIYFYEQIILRRYGNNIMDLPSSVNFIREFEGSSKNKADNEGLPSASYKLALDRFSISQNDILSTFKDSLSFEEQVLVLTDLLELYLTNIDSESKIADFYKENSLKTDEKPGQQNTYDGLKEKSLKILSILSNRDSEGSSANDFLFNLSHIYMLCKQSNFEEGELYLLKLNVTERPEDLLLFYFKRLVNVQDSEEFPVCINYIIDLVEKFASVDVEKSKMLYKISLAKFATLSWTTDSTEYELIKEVVIRCLEKIKNEKILSPLQVFDIFEKIGLSSTESDSEGFSSFITIEMVKPYLLSMFEEETEQINKNLLQIQTYEDEIEKYRSQIDSLLYEPIIFDPPKVCAICLSPLSLPTVNFFCKHVYHLKCLGPSSSEDDNLECPVCKANQNVIQESFHNVNRASNLSNHNALTAQLNATKNEEMGLDVLSSWLSKSVL